MSAQSEITLPTADEIADLYAAKRAALADIDAAQKAREAAALRYQAAEKQLRILLARESYCALTPDQQATLTGPCPTHADSGWWINHGWVKHCRVTQTWAWSLKAEIIRNLLGVL